MSCSSLVPSKCMAGHALLCLRVRSRASLNNWNHNLS
uniref:Uncharacterized protein n=1 Tax=Endocarpon pusillum TaxID=364733 RepID=F8QX01_9EURO|nr:unknown protein [Endocarpon pusillum]